MKWTSVDDQLPDADDLVLVTANGETWLGWIDGEGWHDLEGMPMADVTHWCDLPEPAQQETT